MLKKQKKEQNALAYFKMATPLPSPHTGSRGGFFSNLHSENLVELVEALTLTLVHTEPPAICQLQLRFSYPSADSHRDFCFCLL